MRAQIPAKAHVGFFAAEQWKLAMKTAVGRECGIFYPNVKTIRIHRILWEPEAEWVDLTLHVFFEVTDEKASPKQVESDMNAVIGSNEVLTFEARAYVKNVDEVPEHVANEKNQEILNAIVESKPTMPCATEAIRLFRAQAPDQAGEQGSSTD